MNIEGGSTKSYSVHPDALRSLRRIAFEYHGRTAPYTKQPIFAHWYKAGFKVTSDIHNFRGLQLLEST